MKTILCLLACPLLLFAETDNLTVGNPGNCDVLIDRPGFALGYSNAKQQALWVQYHFTVEENKTRLHRRTNLFLPDPALPPGAPTTEDFAMRFYNRGHLAPAGDMQHSAEAMQASFYLSNISPQHREMNAGIWNDIEKFVRYTVNVERSLYVITGPIFDSNAPVIPTKRIPIPSAFYKIIYDATPPEKMIAFLVPNRRSNAPIHTFATTVDVIEAQTGLDFFTNLPTADTLEAEINLNAWKKLTRWVRENIQLPWEKSQK